MLMAFIAILLTLFLVVGVHELGHALAAYIAKVKISKVSIGFGPSILSWRSQSGCEWVWGLWPLGGYVHLQNTRITPIPPSQYPECFDKKPIWVRILILLAGPLANLLMAWLAFVFIFLLGLQIQLATIQQVQPNSLAAQAGVLANDQILAIGNQKVQSYREVEMGILEHWGKNEVSMRVKQAQGQPRILLLDLSHIPVQPHSLLASLGLVPDLSQTWIWQSHGLIEAFKEANTMIGDLIYFMLVLLKQVVSGVIPFSVLLGPLGLFTLSLSSLSQGILVFTFFIASFSVAVALVNCFPIPTLDGGSILYAVLEKVRGKPISIALEVLIHRLFFIVFCLLLVQLVLNDLSGTTRAQHHTSTRSTPLLLNA